MEIRSKFINREREEGGAFQNLSTGETAGNHLGEQESEWSGEIE